MRERGQGGQSTLEYVAVVLVAAAVLAAGAAGLHGAGIAEALVAQVRRAICIVGGGRCLEAPEPCIVAATATHEDTSLRLVILRLHDGRTVLRERRSDGSERVTLVDRRGVGVGLGVGADIGAGSWVIGGRVDAAVESRGGRGRVWTLHSSRAADALVRALGAGAATPSPDAVYGDRGLTTTVSASLERLGMSLAAEDVLTSATDRRTGERTLLVRRRNELLGEVGLVGPLGAEGGARRDERAALVVDARGRPLRLVLSELRRVQAGARLPTALRAIAGGGGTPLRVGRIVETERALDLGDPASLAAAGAFVRAMRNPRLRLGAAVAVSVALRRRLAAAGSTRVRVYALRVSHGGAHGGVDVGVGLGGGYEHAVERTRLVAAAERDAGGPWRTRDDCLVAA